MNEFVSQSWPAPLPDGVQDNPFIGLTYGQALRLMAERFDGREALVMGDRRWSYQEVLAEVNRASARLRALGLRTGDRVALWLPNRPEFLWIWLGAAQTGLIAVVINTRLKADEAAYQIDQSESRALIVPGDGGFKDFIGEVATVRERLSHLELLIALDHTAAPDVVAWPDLSIGSAVAPQLATDPEAPALISYSSGTTALPKGALITHCVFRKAWDIGIRIDQTESDRLLLAIPLFGSMAMMNGVLPFWVRGGAIVVTERFDPAEFLALAAREHCSITHLLPQMALSLARMPGFDKRALASVRVAFVLSNDASMFSLVADELGIAGVMTGYGLTESTTVAVRNRWDDERQIRLKTQGYALPGVEIRIVDPVGGHELPAGEQGEILLRGYCIMKGYFKKPEESARSVDAHGWLHTGDVGVMHADGRLTFLYRVSEGYKTNGFNVAPAEVEAAVRRHPDVLDVSVFGRNDLVAGQVGVACLVVRPDARINEPEMLAFLRPLLASYKMPRHVVQVDALPVTAGTGKVQKFKLKEQVEPLLPKAALVP